MGCMPRESRFLEVLEAVSRVSGSFPFSAKKRIERRLHTLETQMVEELVVEMLAVELDLLLSFLVLCRA